MTDTIDRGRQHDELVIEGRKRLQGQIEKFCTLMGPHDAAMSFIGTGVAMLLTIYGRGATAGFLTGLLGELEDDDAPTEGTA
jgi:hypothetical protein